MREGAYSAARTRVADSAVEWGGDAAIRPSVIEESSAEDARGDR
jgi:hypothetical protein